MQVRGSKGKVTSTENLDHAMNMVFAIELQRSAGLRKTKS